MAGQPFIAPSTALDRRRLGKFEVLCRLSTGGMSQIYLATQSGIGGFKKLVVLKTILPDIGGEEDFVRMFLEEARTTAAFNHPNIAQVFELDVDAGELFMAMEFVQGCTLVEMAKACRAAKEPIPVGFTLQSVRDTALALHYAHTFTDPRGRKQIVIHRDVAEKNIMVTYEGVTKLLDFGIAKALGRSSRTSIGMVKGTSGYMSPEQIRGEPLDSRSDIFSLGVVLHECLTGLRLFHGKNAEEGMMAALNTTVAPPSRTNPEVTPEVDAVVMKSLQRKREDRFATALEFARAIEKAAPGLIWHPEQSAELVSRHFSDRRQETRRILEATNYGSETTGEIRIDSLIAKVKVTGAEARASAPTAPPTTSPDAQTPAAPPPPTPPTGLPNSLRRTTPPPPATSAPSALRKPGPPVPAPTPPTGVPNSLRKAPPPTVPMSLSPEPDTNPARPRVLRGGAAVSPPVDQGPTPFNPLVVRLDPPPNNYDDDSEAKTIPAAALPDEIKQLRAKILAQQKPTRPTEPQPQPAHSPPSVVVSPEVPKPQPPSLAKTIPAGVSATPPPVQVPIPIRTTTGDTLSITNRASPGDWADDEPEAKTAIGLPFDVVSNKPPTVRRPPPTNLITEPSRAVAGKTSDEEDDDDDFRETVASVQSGRSTLLVVLLLVPLFIAAVLSILYALGVGPFEREPEPTIVPREKVDPRPVK
ncbi:MAG: protein kinase [Myxococcaceae bacterium]|nr:protein kinase [Myxococcaceae bacterium]